MSIRRCHALTGLLEVAVDGTHEIARRTGRERKRVFRLFFDNSCCDGENNTLTQLHTTTTARATSSTDAIVFRASGAMSQLSSINIKYYVSGITAIVTSNDGRDEVVGRIFGRSRHDARTLCRGRAV